MPRIYQARDITDASLLRDVLGQSGIDAHVRGGDLQSGVGELPAGGLVSVWVADADVDAARDVVARWERGEFALPGDAEDPAEERQARSGASPRKVATLLTFIAGGLLGASMVWFTTHGPETEDAIDHDEDGRIDERFFFSPQGLERVETDRNRDGKVDSTGHYLAGMATHGENDDDFDGRAETRLRYVRNVLIESESDWNGDGAVDYRIEANAGVIGREQWLDAEGRVVKQVLYEGGRARAVELDRDGDGMFEIRRALDRTAEPVAR